MLRYGANLEGEMDDGAAMVVVAMNVTHREAG